MDAALGGDHHFFAAASERAADEVLAFAIGAVNMSRIQMIDADVEALLDRGDAIGVVRAERADTGNRPAAERDGRNRQSRIAERSKLGGWQGHEIKDWLMYG